MQDKERDEILYRLDERTKRVDEHLDRLERRIANIEKQTDAHEERINDNEDAISTARKGVAGVGSALLAAIGGAAARIAGVLQI